MLGLHDGFKLIGALAAKMAWPRDDPGTSERRPARPALYLLTEGGLATATLGHLANFVLDWLTHGWLHLRSRDRRALFCSQLVSRAYVKGGVDLNVRYGDAATAPGALVAGDRIELVHVFAKQAVVDKLS